MLQNFSLKTNYWGNLFAIFFSRGMFPSKYIMAPKSKKTYSSTITAVNWAEKDWDRIPLKNTNSAILKIMSSLEVIEWVLGMGIKGVQWSVWNLLILSTLSWALNKMCQFHRRLVVFISFSISLIVLCGFMFLQKRLDTR